MQRLLDVLGPEGSKLVIWLLVAVAVLIGLALVAWLFMRMFGRGLNMSSGGRGQPQRLGITGAFNLDRKGRKLVIVRRDNVEHLLLIGGPNDVLVESTIIRAERLSRAGAAAGLPVETADAVPAATPAPVPTAAPAPAVVTPVMPPPVAKPVPPLLPEEPAVRVAPRVDPAPPPPVVTAPPRPVSPPVPPPAPVIAPAPVPAAPVMRPPTAAVTQKDPQPDAALDVAPVVTEPPVKPAAADPRLSDMARRLQSVLNRPLSPMRPAQPVDAKAAAEAETKPIPLPSAAARTKDPDPVAEPAEEPPAKPAKPAKSAEKPAPAPVTQGKDLPPAPISPDSQTIDSLEEEMARLLGRSGPGKT